jgi:hypothetical protein
MSTHDKTLDDKNDSEDKEIEPLYGRSKSN